MRKTITLMVTATIILAAATALAENVITVNGTFKGALYSYLGKKHPAMLTKAQIALEPDFVLCDESGKDYFVANLPRLKKVSCVNELVRVSGKLDEDGTLCAECLEVYRNDKYVKVWDLDQEIAERKALLR
ncbi:exported hypothetical protein [Desulfosarcina cetonica]|uniref:hypothetical protein n=1 Tax=Desulfosarcina cetonica TaxID=90730 RepID=UPI0006D16010|nr:hypothetical protein [Desulfosarcina cetonica]VTR68346.1 exported hypothetical protein [Desulfosarcina cetonica]